MKVIDSFDFQIKGVLPKALLAGRKSEIEGDGLNGNGRDKNEKESKYIK